MRQAPSQNPLVTLEATPARLRSAGRARRMPIKAVAAHEAGHMILADHFGILEYGTIEDEPHCQIRVGDSLVPAESIEGYRIRGIVAHGGVIAEAKYTKKAEYIAWLFTGRDDAEKIKKYVDRIIGYGNESGESIDCYRKTIDHQMYDVSKVSVHRAG